MVSAILYNATDQASIPTAVCKQLVRSLCDRMGFLQVPPPIPKMYGLGLVSCGSGYKGTVVGPSWTGLVAHTNMRQRNVRVSAGVADGEDAVLERTEVITLLAGDLLRSILNT